jgi:hypothetical protein
MRKIVVLAVAVGSLVFAAPAFPLAITNPATGDCFVALSPSAFQAGPQGVAFPAPWNGVFNSSDSAPLSVHC